MPDAGPWHRYSVRPDTENPRRTGAAETARALIEATDAPYPDIAFAAGLHSVRELESALHRHYGADPQFLRDHAQRRTAGHPISLTVRLPVRPPFAYAGVFGHLAACAVPGCEEVRGRTYRRTLRLPHGTGIVGLTPHHDHVRCKLTLDDRRDLTAAIAKCRRLLDLDADPQPISEALAADPALRPAVHRAPGQRVPGTVDEHELAVRVVLSQQVSLQAAATHAGRLVAAYGEPISDPDGALTHAFPSAERLAGIDPAQLALPRTRRAALLALISALADGSLALAAGCDWERARSRLRALPGIGPWTTEVIAMRGLGDPDAFPVADLGLRAAAAQLGLPAGAPALTAHSRAWRPWRAYATQQLWATLDHPVNRWPPKEDT